MPGVVKQNVRVTREHPLRGFGGRKNIKSASLLAASVVPSGVDEVQLITISGGPTGGTFTPSFKGVAAAAQAFNATADALETALEAVSTIGAGNVRVTGAAGGPYSVTFQRDLGRQDVPQMTIAHALTGGTTPSAAVTTPTAGSAVNAGLLLVQRGTILTKVPGNTSKVRRYTAQGGEAIWGVLFMDALLMDTSSASDTDVPVIRGPGADFDKNKIIDYATYQAAFDTWVASRGCVVG